MRAVAVVPVGCFLSRLPVNGSAVFVLRYAIVTIDASDDQATSFQLE